MSAFVVLDDVSHAYGGNIETPAVEGLSISINEGEFAAVVGPSGCGKSTLMKLATGLQFPFKGTIRVAGDVVDKPLKIAGMAFQAPTLLPSRLTRIFRDDTTEVSRWADDERSAAADRLSTDRQRIFGALIESFAELPGRKSKFKLFRVELDGPEIVTVQYFHLSGRSSSRARSGCGSRRGMDRRSGPTAAAAAG